MLSVRGVRGPAAILVALVAVVGVISCSPSEQEADNAGGIHSFQTTMSERRVDDDGSVFERRVITQQAFPWRVHVQRFDGEGLLMSESILILHEGAEYHSVTLDPPTWRKEDVSIRTGPESLSTDALSRAPLQFLYVVEDLGTETLDGQTLRRQRGVTDLKQWADAALAVVTDDSVEDLRLQLLTGHQEVDIWSSVDDNRLVKYVVRGVFPPVGSRAGYSSEVTHEYDRYNEEFDISAPPANQIVEEPQPWP